MTRKICTACRLGPVADMKHCHECKGLGYIDRPDRMEGCNKRAPFETPSGPCPLEGEAMTGGWYCTYCGDSGPL